MTQPPLNACGTPLSCAQGVAGEENNLTVALVDILGRPFGGDVQSVDVVLNATGAENTSSILGFWSDSAGSLTVQWTGTEATPADDSLLYQIEVAVAETGQVSWAGND